MDSMIQVKGDGNQRLPKGALAKPAFSRNFAPGPIRAHGAPRVRGGYGEGKGTPGDFIFRSKKFVWAESSNGKLKFLIMCVVVRLRFVI